MGGASNGEAVLNLGQNRSAFAFDGTDTYIVAYGDLYLNSTGIVKALSGIIGNSVAVGCAPYGSLSNPYESIQLDSSHNLRIAFGGTEVYIFENNGTFQPQISVNAPYPMCGSSSRPWEATYAQYSAYHYTYTSWDAVDDLGLAKQLKTIKEQRTHPKTGEKFELDVLSRDSLKFLEDEDGFYRSYDVTGYLLCCVKALVEKIESLENQLPKKREP